MASVDALRFLRLTSGSGHPHSVVLCAIQGLKELVKKLSDVLTDQITPDYDKSSAAQVIQQTFTILRHVEILARYNGNRDSLIMHSAIDPIVTVLDLSGAAIIRLDDSDSASLHLADSSPDLGNLSMCCMTIL